MALAQITDSDKTVFQPIIRETPEALFTSDFKIVRETTTWVISGNSLPHKVRLLPLPLDLTRINPQLLFQLLDSFQIQPGEEFWEWRLEEEYGKRIRDLRPHCLSAEQQYNDLWRVKRVLDSPLFNRNYSALETNLPLDRITAGDRIDLIASLPINLVNKYQDLRYRLIVGGKTGVLAWLNETDPTL